MSYIPRNLDDEIKALNLATHELPLQDLIEFVVHILMKLPSIRSEKEVEFLRQYMNKNSFFTSMIKKFGDQVANEIFVLLEHRVLKAGQPLYTAGTVGQSAFILLKGAVEYPVKLEPGTDQSGFMKAKCIEKTTGAVFGDFRKADEETVNNDTLLICRQDSHFAVFQKKEYDKIATFYKIKIMQDQIAFLLSLPIFQGWQPHHMKQWLDIFEKKTYKRKAVVYKQNDPSNHIYIIKSGSVLCNKVIPIKANLLGGHEVGVDEENNVFLVDNRLLCRTVEVAVLGHGQILGDEEALDMYSIAKSRENRSQEKKPLAKRSKNANAQDHKKEEILDFDHISVKRETSMSVSTPEAEIWSISIREFFTKLEHHKTELDMVIAYITEKKRRLNVRINTIMQNSQEYVGFLQSQNSAAALKKDVNMKTNTLTRCSTTTQSKEKLIEEPANNQSSKPNLKSTQKVWLLPDKTPEDNQSSIKKLKKDNSITQSLQKDDSNNNNKSIYDILNKQESINSNITTSWSPPKLVLTKSKTVAGRSSSNINRRLKSFKETKQTEKSETLEDDVDPNTSLDKSAIKPDKNIVNEIRTFHPTQVLNSRTAYIGYAVERRATINEKLQEKVLIRQTTDPDTCPEIENLRLVPKAVAEPKWRVMAYRHQSRKPSTAQQEMDTSNPNIKFRDESRLIVNYYKKITKVDLNGSALGPDQSREEANRSRPDLNASRRSFQGVTLNASGSKTDISQSKADYYSPKIDSNNASAIKPVSVFEPEKYKLNVSERFLGADGNETAFQAKAKLESLLLVGKKNSKEDNKYSRETGEQKRCYVSGLFPGFRPKTFIKRDVDAGELYRQNLKSEAERRLTRAFRDVNKTLNTSADQVPGERLNKSVVNEVEAMLAKELKLLSKGQKNY